MENVDTQVDAAINAMEDGIDAAIRSVERRQQNEAAGVMDIVGIVISAPFILQILGNGLKIAQQFIQGNKADEQTIGDFVVKFADKMHHVLMKPLELLAATFTKDVDKQHKFAEVMMSGIVLILLLSSGVSLIKYLRKFKISKSVLYAFKSGVKGAELRTLVTKLANVAKSEIGVK